MSTSMIEIPSNVNVLGWKNKSTPIVQKKKRTTRRYKTPLAVRKKLATARKKVKLPLAPIAAVGTPVLMAGKAAMAGSRIQDKLDIFFRRMLEYYTGIRITGTAASPSIAFNLKSAGVGTLPLVALAADAKFLGARAYANRLLANANIPLIRV